MIKISNIEVFNFDGAFRGLRNPMNSWDKSDSEWWGFGNREFLIGEKDLKLAQRMISAGTDESKFMRQIFVSMDITSSLYFFKEIDTYKVSTVANSTSTMHKLSTTPITKECFSFDEEDEKLTSLNVEDYLYCKDSIDFIVERCETLRQKYLETKDKRYWRLLIQLLPESWNQTRTWTANYQVLRNIYFARRNHKLIEWKDFCRMIEKLPYGKELICYEKEE